MARGGAHRRPGPPRAAADRDPARGRCPRLLPAAPAPAARGVPRGRRLRGAARARGAAAALHQLDAARSTSAACRRAWAVVVPPDGGEGWRLRLELEAEVRREPAPNVLAAAGRPTGSAGPSPPGPRWPPSSVRRRRVCGVAARRPTRATRASPGSRPRPPGLEGGGREDARLRGPPRDPGAAAHRAQPPGRSSPPASSTRSCRPRAATSRSRSSACPRARACSSRPSAAARAATSSSATASCCSTCPGDPVVVEQRIGRLDRIGRAHPGGDRLLPSRAAASAPTSLRLFEAIGLFREPLAGLEPELRRRSEAVARGGRGRSRRFRVRRCSSRRWWAKPARRARASRRRRTTSCTATPTGRRWRAAILARVPRRARRAQRAAW